MPCIVGGRFEVIPLLETVEKAVNGSHRYPCLILLLRQRSHCITDSTELYHVIGYEAFAGQNPCEDSIPGFKKILAIGYICIDDPGFAVNEHNRTVEVFTPQSSAVSVAGIFYPPEIIACFLCRKPHKSLLPVTGKEQKQWQTQGPSFHQADL